MLSGVTEGDYVPFTNYEKIELNSKLNRLNGDKVRILWLLNLTTSFLL